MKPSTMYILGFGLVIAICASAFIISPAGEFGGADDQGSDKIEEIDPDFQPWASSLWSPPPETESLLFAVQAAIGAVIIGYFIGNERGKKVAIKNSEKLETVQAKAMMTSSIEGPNK